MCECVWDKGESRGKVGKGGKGKVEKGGEEDEGPNAKHPNRRTATHPVHPRRERKHRLCLGRLGTKQSGFHLAGRGRVTRISTRAQGKVNQYHNHKANLS